MHPHPTLTTPPPGSAAAALLPGAYFHDAWAIRPAQPQLEPLDQFLRVARQTPAWVDGLMNLRNRLVGLVGLKNLGALSRLSPGAVASDFRIGDRVGIFTLLARSDTEALLGDSDKHLDVVVSIHRQPGVPADQALVTVSTVVKVHNLLGRLYMLPVRPAHHLIARTMVKAVGRAD